MKQTIDYLPEHLLAETPVRHDANSSKGQPHLNESGKKAFGVNSLRPVRSLIRSKSLRPKRTKGLVAKKIKALI